MAFGELSNKHNSTGIGSNASSACLNLIVAESNRVKHASLPMHVKREMCSW